MESSADPPEKCMKMDTPSEDNGDVICIIHHKDSLNQQFKLFSSIQDPEGRFNKIKEVCRMRQMQPQTSSYRFDEMCKSIPENLDQKHGFHKDCYQRFTNNLNRLQNISTDVSSTSQRSRRTSAENKDKVLFSANCIFCNSDKRIGVNKQGKRTTEGTSLFEYGGGETIKQSALEKGDETLLCKIRGVDLFAVEAKYHPSCRKKYTLLTERNRSTNKENVDRQTEMENAHKYALDVVCTQIQTNVIVNRNIMKLTDLNTVYITALGETPFPNPDRKAIKLKSKLQNHSIGNLISFTGSGAFTSLLVYSNAIDVATAVNMSYKLGNEDTVSTIAQELRNMILDEFETSSELPWPPTDEYLLDVEGKVPTVLQSFLKNILASNPNKENSKLNRLVLSIGQDICYAITHGRWKMPKHILLCMTLRHLFRSKELITILNKFGHSDNYSFSLELETAIAKSVQESSSVLSQQIIRNPTERSLFHSEFDNFDQFVSELSGSGSVHTAHGIMLQELQTSSIDEPIDIGPQVERTGERTLNIQPVEYLPECYVSQRKSPVMIIKREHDENGDIAASACQIRNTAWILVRVSGSSMPGWAGFVSITGDPPHRLTTIGYYPVIYHPITDYRTVQECLRVAEEATDAVGQKYVITTFDLGVCMKAFPLVWNNTERYKNHIILIGTFHLTCAYFHMLGKKMDGCGLSDILIESGLITSGSLHSVLTGKNYSRALHCHKIVMEALERLLIKEFLHMKGESAVCFGLSDSSQEKMTKLVTDPGKETLNNVLEDPSITTYVTSYLKFKEEVRNGLLGKTAKFWLSYMDHVWLVLQLLESVKINDFDLYAHCIHRMSSFFFAYSGQNYARYATMFSVFLTNIDETHPDAKDLLKQGAFSVARSMKPGCRCEVDKTMEETFMKNAKSRGGSGGTGVGLSGIARNYSAYQRWVLTTHERVRYLDMTMELADMTRCSTNLHKDLGKKEIKEGHNKVRKTVEAIENFANPFTIDKDHLYMLSSGNQVPQDIESDLLNAESYGINSRDQFVQERLKANDKFFDPIKRLNLKCMADMKKTVKVQSAKNKVVEYKHQSNIVTKLLIKSQEESAKIDIPELMTYSLTPVPYCIGTADGYLAKTNKATTFLHITKQVENEALPTDCRQMMTVEDGNTLFHYMREIPPTFEQICEKLYDITAQKGDVIVSIDMYSTTSVKALERKRRGAGDKLIVVGPKTRKPKDWREFLGNDENKQQLIEQMHQVWTGDEVRRKSQGRSVILVKEGVACNIQDGNIINDLTSNQEETDSRVVLYCKYAARNGYKYVRVKSPDSDIFWILLYHSFDIECTVLFETGHGNQKRLINVSKIAENYGRPMCSAFLGLHAYTGCDSVSAFKGKGKLAALRRLLKSPTQSRTFQLLGSSFDVSEELIDGLEKLTCAMYGKPTCKSVDKVRQLKIEALCKSDDFNFTAKSNIDLSLMPPSRACLIEHIKRANYQARIWRLAAEPIVELPMPFEGHGWLPDGEPLWCPNDKIVPPSLVDILLDTGDTDVDDDIERHDDSDSNSESDMDDSDSDYD